MNNTGYVDYILDILSPFGTIKSRKMFGGYGIYKNGIFFALIIDDILYFKVGDSNRSDYEEKNSNPFSYLRPDGKRVAMSYWEVPSDVIENHTELALWVEKSAMVAQEALINKPKPKRLPPTRN